MVSYGGQTEARRGIMGGLSTSQTARRALLVVGMCTAWLPVTDRLLYPVSFTYTNTGDTTAYLYSIIYSVLAISIALAVGIVAYRSKSTSFVGGRAVLATGVGGAVRVLSTSIFDFSNPVSALLVGIGVVLVAVYVPIHFVFWSFRLARTPGKAVLTDAALSFVVSSLASAVLTSLGASTLGMAVAFPLASGLLGFAYMRAGFDEEAVEGRLALPVKESIFVVSLVLILLCNVAIAYFNNSAKLQADYPFRALIFWGQVATFAVIAFFYHPGKGRKLATMDSFAMVSLTFIGMLLVAIFASGSLLNVGTVPLNCANTVLIAFAWLLVVRDANRRRESLVFVLSLYLAVVVLLLRFVQACVMFAPNFLTLLAQSIDYVYLVAAIVFLAVCIVFAALFLTFAETHKRGFGTAGSASADAGEPDAAAPAPPEIPEEYVADARRVAQHEAALLRLSETAKLSNREMEVARLALRNYSAKKMSQVLFISENTVYSHLKRIYQKTDVHSRHDLIELVDRLSRER